MDIRCATWWRPRLLQAAVTDERSPGKAKALSFVLYVLASYVGVLLLVIMQQDWGLHEDMEEDDCRTTIPFVALAWQHSPPSILRHGSGR